MIKKLLVPFILGTIVSFYFFPIGFTFLPGALNSKVLLALFGVCMFLFECMKSRQLELSKDVFRSALIALLFSAVCYISVLINDTGDTSYVTYFVSFFTWVGGAYGVVFLLKKKYGVVDIHLVSRYLLWVAVAQCISCLMIDNIPAFSAFVDAFMNIGQASVREMGRKYGIGSALDAGGVRFAIILVVAAYELCSQVLAKKNFGNALMYILAYFFVILVGNMISRTTTVGGLMGLGYMLLYLFKLNNGVLRSDQIRTFMAVILILAAGIPFLAYLYNTDAAMHSDLRFAFEGFFNWAETGEWRTDSTDKLNGVMWVWPEDTKTWIIGSGIFGGWFYGTDIGYCRFTLYCGLIGFGIFSYFFIYNAILVSRKFPGTNFLALMLMALTFVIWIKVSTDIFMVYALLFCVDAVAEDDFEDIYIPAARKSE